MIPTLVFAGLLLGRWWRVVVPVTAVAWPVWLLADGQAFEVAPLLVAAVLAAVNTVVGVVVNRLIVAVLPHSRRRPRSAGGRQARCRP